MPNEIVRPEEAAKVVLPEVRKRIDTYREAGIPDEDIQGVLAHMFNSWALSNCEPVDLSPRPRSLKAYGPSDRIPDDPKPVDFSKPRYKS